MSVSMLFIVAMLSGVFFTIYTMLMLKYSKCGTLAEDNYLKEHFYIGLFLVITGLTIQTLCTNPALQDLVGEDKKELYGIIIFTGIGTYIISVVIGAIILTVCLKSYNDYKEACLAFGFDLKEYTGKFIVITREDDWIKNDDANKWEVKVLRIIPVKSWCGDFAKTVRVANLGNIAQNDCNKEAISDLTKKYFEDRKSFRGTYLVKSDSSITEHENKDIEVIIV